MCLFCSRSPSNAMRSQLQAFFLVADDLMDGSHTRRGNPCWFRLPDVRTTSLLLLSLNSVAQVGLNAANDSLILEACLYKVLKRYFRQDPFYVSLFELMQEVCVSRRIV